MIISKLHVHKIEQKLALIRELPFALQMLAGIEEEEEFLKDKRNPAVVESYLRRSLEAMFDIGRHIIAKSYGAKELEYKNAIELGEKGVVHKEYSRILLKMAGYRDRMVHLYFELMPL